MLVPPPGKEPPPRGNPGCATDIFTRVRSWKGEGTLWSRVPGPFLGVTQVRPAAPQDRPVSHLDRTRGTPRQDSGVCPWTGQATQYTSCGHAGGLSLPAASEGWGKGMFHFVHPHLGGGTPVPGSFLGPFWRVPPSQDWGTPLLEQVMLWPVCPMRFPTGGLSCVCLKVHKLDHLQMAFDCSHTYSYSIKSN